MLNVRGAHNPILNRTGYSSAPRYSAATADSRVVRCCIDYYPPWVLTAVESTLLIGRLRSRELMVEDSLPVLRFNLAILIV